MDDQIRAYKEHLAKQLIDANILLDVLQDRKPYVIESAVFVKNLQLQL